MTVLGQAEVRGSPDRVTVLVDRLPRRVFGVLLQEDSTVALAYTRLSTAAGWGGVEGVRNPLRRAYALSDQVPVQDRCLTQARHLRVQTVDPEAAAVIHIGFGVLAMIGALFVFLAVAGSSLLSGSLAAIVVTSGIAVLVWGFLALTALPSIIGGVGLLARKNWARSLIMIVAVFDVLNVPIGTLITISTF